MKKLYTLTLFIIVTSGLSAAQQLHWQWAKQANAQFNSFKTISPVVNGCFYVIATFTGTQVVLNNTTVTVPDNGTNFFIAKYDTAGNVIWAKGISDYGLTVGPNCMTVDKYGNAYVTGQFSDSIVTFGSYLLHGKPISIFNGSNYFIVKYDVSGNVVWAHTATGSPSVAGMCSDANNNIYVTGVVGTSGGINTASFDGDTIDGTGAHGKLDYFLLKYDEAGSVKWLHGATISGNTGLTVGNQPMTCDSLGNIYVSVWLRDSSINFDGHIVYDSLGTSECCLVKYDTLGNVQWAQILNSQSPGFNDISATPSGNLYYYGYYADSVIIGTIKLIAPTTSFATFLARYDSSGRVIWALNLPARPDCITTDAIGNVYLGGNFIDTIPFGSDTIIAPDYYNSFILKYSASGLPIWAKSLPGNFSAVEYSLSVDTRGNIYVGGNFQDTVEFTGLDTFVSISNNSLYIARLDQCNEIVPAISRFGTDTLTTQAFAQYQWLLNGNPISNANNQSYIPLHNGDYQVQVTDSGGCQGLSAALQVLNLYIPSIPNTAQVFLYPNPSYGTFTLSSNNALGNVFTIYDAVGNIVKSQTINSDNEFVDLSPNSSGIYYVNLKTSDATYNLKFIIVK